MYKLLILCLFVISSLYAQEETNFSKITIVAQEAAIKAGDILKKGFGTQFDIQSKEGKQNFATEYDLASEKCIIETILGYFPDHGIIAEESGINKGKTAPVIWIIDPLDGTNNFVNKIPFFSISIAASINDEIVSGVVYIPILGELFLAEKGKGAYLNGTRLKVSDKESVEKASMGIGFPYNVHENPQHCIEQFLHFLKYGLPIRILGSAAIDLAYVAAGRYDFFHTRLYPWDIAAGKLLVEEAGGKISHQDGSTHEIYGQVDILATNGKLHQAIISELNSFNSN